MLAGEPHAGVGVVTLPTETEARGAVMRPEVWLLSTTGGVPDYPAQVTVDDGGTPRVVPVWDVELTASVGGLPTREYRHRLYPARVSVLQRVAAVTLPGPRPGAIVLWWVPASARLGTNGLADAIRDAVGADLLKRWPCALHASGAIVVPVLDADGTAPATLVKGAWPSTWRLPLPGDVEGTPTGARCLGVVLAA